MEEFDDAAALDHNIKRSLLSRNRLAIITKGRDGKIQYSCVQCPVKYDDKEKLQLHLYMHNNEYRFLCGICGTGLKRKEHLDRHILGHQEVRPHVCSECGKAFKRKEHLNIHKSIHSGEKSQVCSLCNRSFYRKDHLQKHLQTHFSPVMDGYEMGNEGELQTSDEVDVKPIFVDINDFKPDMDYESQENETDTSKPPMQIDVSRPYMCLVCHKSYKRKDHLKLHTQTHMEKGKVCSECGKAFHRQDQLLVHMNVHLRTLGKQSLEQLNVKDEPEDEGSLLIPMPMKDIRPHECSVCGKRFKRRQHLKVHSGVHLKARPGALAPAVWCSICRAGFVNESQFEQHECLQEKMSAEHQQTHDEENDFPLEIVDIIVHYDISAAVQDENESQECDMSGEGPAYRPIPVPQRVFVCKYCSKPFRRKDHYKIHLHIHTGVKSFFCVDCGKGFYRKDHLQKHTQVHARNPKPKKQLPGLYPISMLPKKSASSNVTPEITIHAPSSAKLRVPLQIKVPYQMVMEMANGEQRAITVDPQAPADSDS